MSLAAMTAAHRAEVRLVDLWGFRIYDIVYVGFPPGSKNART